MMVDIKWCKKQAKGIEMISPNGNLALSYIMEADKNLSAMENIKGKWAVIIGYYACYCALYSILMKAGIKCEIHDCTLAVMKVIEGFDMQDMDFMRSLKTDRIDAQYYLKEIELENPAAVKDFVLKCKIISKDLDIEALRNTIGDKN